jgi:hypothetical protein
MPVGISLDREILYAQGGTAYKSLYQSTDDGLTWALLEVFAEPVVGLVELDDGEAIVVTQNAGSSPGYMYRSSGWAASHTAATWSQRLVSHAGYFRAYWGGGHAFSFGDNAVRAASGKYGITNEYGAQTVANADNTTGRATQAYFTEDYGQTWQVVLDLNLRYPGVAPLHLHASAYDPWWDRLWVTYGDKQSDVATSLGLLYSDDHGVTWQAHVNAPEWQGGDYFQSTPIGVFKDCILLGSDNAPGLIRIARDGYRVSGAMQVVAVSATQTGGQMIANGLHRNRRQADAPIVMTTQTQQNWAAGAEIYVSVDNGFTFQQVWRDPLIGGVRTLNQQQIFGPTTDGYFASACDGGRMMRGRLVTAAEGLFDNTANFVGDGATKVFTVPHGRSVIPSQLQGWSVNAVGGPFVLTANNVDLVFTFTTAPANGVTAAVAYRFSPVGSTATSSATTWLTRSGSTAKLNNQTYRSSMINAYWLGNNDNDMVGSPVMADYPTLAETTEAFADVSAMGIGWVRATTLGVNYGSANCVVTGRDASGFIINQAAWAPIDNAIRQARLKGVRLMIPFLDLWRFYATGDGTRQTGHGGRWWFVHARAGSQPAATLNLLRSKSAAESETSAAYYSTGVAVGNPPTVVLGTEWAAHGTKSVKVTYNSASNAWVYIDGGANGAPVVAGQTYTAAATVRRTAGAANVSAHLTWFNAAGQFISGVNGTSVTTVSATGTTVTCTAVAPVGAVTALPQVELTSSPAVGDVMWIDDWAIYAGATAPAAWVAPATDYISDTDADLRITTFSDKSGQNRTDRVAAEKSAEQQLYTNPVLIQDVLDWISLLMNHTVDGLALKNDPICQIWEMGNELGDLAGPGNNAVVGKAFMTTLAKHVKSLSPNSWFASGFMANGARVSDDPGLTISEVDVAGVHPYYGKAFDAAYFATLQEDYDAAMAANKLFVMAEVPLHNSQRAALVSWVESHPGVLFMGHWTLVLTGQTHGAAVADANDDVPLHYPGENAAEVALVSALTAHANAVGGKPVPQA